MKINQFEIWIADLNPRQGTETGKIRPVLVVQTDLLNKIHTSVIVCPITTNLQTESVILRTHLKKGEANLREDCDIMIDQVRTIDIKRLVNKIGKISIDKSALVKENLKIVLDLEGN